MINEGEKIVMGLFSFDGDDKEEGELWLISMVGLLVQLELLFFSFFLNYLGKKFKQAGLGYNYRISIIKTFL